MRNIDSTIQIRFRLLNFNLNRRSVMALINSSSVSEIEPNFRQPVSSAKAKRYAIAMISEALIKLSGVKRTPFIMHSKVIHYLLI